MAGFVHKIRELIREELALQLQAAVDAANQTKAAWADFQLQRDRIQKIERRVAALERAQAMQEFGHGAESKAKRS